eukprot:CAMPEP_0114580730 /NCGR_PEP_ID=MMETSP0125-20121206/4948_1 /TAXON_ID=485358 ORGANISM="Aristerostoma sp., Strain ATCC 50986" /NCGR_SAMPLE_ID=MMETSP0125 /ASSEMBLY_ACC=CAM_ASM_000245 /LENGTH=70 /DNA_ID=CAMNT_0001772449 /DNA_START=555 /DNA_END=767 /DNA_ORIENTATION=+
MKRDMKDLEEKYRAQLFDMEKLHDADLKGTLEKEVTHLNMRHSQVTSDLEKKNILLGEEMSALETKYNFS